jgi:glycine dehydrogenase subunit 1
MAFGGPYLGIMACRQQFLRRMPGRLVGQTVDRRGRRCWVLTLQTREQHIRREKATSNICTNQGLYALRATVYLSLMGPAGMRSAAELCLQKSRYAAQRLAAVPSFSLAFDRPTFKEFVVRVEGQPVDMLIERARRENIFAGVPLGPWYPQLDDCMLVAVTEKRTKEEIDRLVTILSDNGP